MTTTQLPTRQTPIQRRIASLMPSCDARHTEAVMRDENVGTDLMRLRDDAFAEEALICAGMAQDEPDRAEMLALGIGI